MMSTMAQGCSGGLSEALGDQGGMHLRALSDAGEPRLDGRERLQVYVHEVRPVDDGEAIGISGAEGLAEYEVVRLQMLVEFAEALHDLRLERILGCFRRRLVEEWAELLVELGRDEGKPLHRLIAFLRTHLRDDVRIGLLVGDE